VTGAVHKRGASDFVNNAVNAVSSLNDFNVDKTTTLQPLDLDKTFNLVTQQIDCSAAVGTGNSTVGSNGKVTVDVDAKVHAVVSLGVVAAGTIVPPEMDQFGLTSGQCSNGSSFAMQGSFYGVGMTATIDGSIILKAGVGGTLDSGKIKLFEVGVPGLDVPGYVVVSVCVAIETDKETGFCQWVQLCRLTHKRSHPLTWTSI